MNRSSQTEKSLTSRLMAWWSGLQEPGKTGERAELRRCKTVAEVVMTPAFQRQCSKMSDEIKTDFDREHLAAVMGLLSHLDKDSLNNKQKLAEQMAGNPPVVSELRFRRLLQRGRDELYVAMIRIIRMLNNKVDPFDLINSVYYWGDSTKKRWAYAYFSRTPAKSSN